MRPPRLLPALVLAGALFTAPLSAQFMPPEPIPEGAENFGVLFQDHEPLTLRIEADFDQILDDRDQDSEERDGMLYVIQPDGTEEGHEVEIKTRGRFRLQNSTCRFPPLRVDFPRSYMEGTVFEGQDKLKLVTHCRDGDRFEQNTVKEYLVYRIYNLLTPLSFQVRMAQITYVDTSGEDDPVTRWGFFIEAEEEIAARLGAEIIDLEQEPDGRIHPARMAGWNTGRLALFQYMVGNTDFSIYQGHNAVPFDPAEGRVIPMPYDFDWTGLVNAPYARPDPSLGTRNVRQRVFRGLCRPDVNYETLYADFLELKPEIMALVQEDPRLGEDEREDVVDYLNDFWETIEDEGDRESRIERECRPV